MHLLICLIPLLFSCSFLSNSDIPIDPKLKAYWYNNEAEISSYELSQARYGENHKGNAVMVFVTEPFSKKTGTKPNASSKEDVSVMKLNFTKKFNTGIYPYSMMNSTFFPFEKGKHSLKISSSSQEWCGHTYMELNTKNQYEVKIHSYFDGESKEKVKLDKDLLEDDLWTMIRLHSDKLPTGTHQVIPSFFFLRLRHQTLKAYDCELSLTKNKDDVNVYSLNYPTLNRRISIRFENKFPFKILGWEETATSGFGPSQKILTTSATLIKTIKSDYWKHNGNVDAKLREELGL